jgi:DNA (cytosine-5)-methyltransferase 1
MPKKPKFIPVIDLFAGPGGLGEGFSRLPIGGDKQFKILLSVEKDKYAHQTLTLRAFFRQFEESKVPSAYYEYVKGEINLEQLFRHFPEQALAAQEEAQLLTLGEHDVSSLIGKRLNGRKNWVLIGGPPCQAYSLVGRSRMTGGTRLEGETAEAFNKRIHQRRSKFAQDHRHHLYKEYLRIIGDHWPPFFVMENVKGILSAKVNGELIFPQILQDLSSPAKALNRRPRIKYEYKIYSFSTEAPDGDWTSLNPSDYLIRSEAYAIPQARHRVILFGVRSDKKLREIPVLKELGSSAVINAIGRLPKLTAGLTGKCKDSSVTVLGSIKTTDWWMELDEIPELRSVKKRMENELDQLKVYGNGGGRFMKSVRKYSDEWFYDPQLGGILNHEARDHMKEDLWRYFFCSCYAKEFPGKSPKLKDFPTSLLPAHKNVGEAVSRGKFGDRFRVQMEGKPATTVTSHISKDGHYFIHYDPKQCRSLTVREAARLQTFPDNYFFEGPRTAQFHQVGNAVPPRLAYQLAEIVAKVT